MILSLYEQSVVQSQTNFSWNEQGVSPRYSVLSFDGIDASALYNKTLEWIKSTYRYPEKVITTSTPNQRIRIEVSENIGEVKKVRFPYLITIEISFKDSKLKYEPIGTQNPAAQRDLPDMDFSLVDFPKNIPQDGLKVNLVRIKKEKVIENTSKTMDNFVSFLNSSLSSLSNFIQRKDDW